MKPLILITLILLLSGCSYYVCEKKTMEEVCDHCKHIDQCGALCDNSCEVSMGSRAKQSAGNIQELDVGKKIVCNCTCSSNCRIERIRR